MQDTTEQRGIVTAPQNHVWSIDNPEIFQPFRLSPVGAGAGAGRGFVGASLDTQESPQGGLLLEAQGQITLSMARAMVAKLARTMARNGRTLSDATAADATGAGAAAVVAWRNGQACDRAERGAAGVCWRAIVAEVSKGHEAESIEAWRGTEGDYDSLTGSMLPLPPLTGDETRWDKACRLRFERDRAQRPALLEAKIEALKSRGGRGKRAEVIDKINRACILLLHGSSVDDAATGAGFKASGQTRAGDQLMRAVRRLGFKVQFTFNWRNVAEGKERGAVHTFAPMDPRTASAFDFLPSATLPLDDGRGGKRLIPSVARRARARARALKLAQAKAREATRATHDNAKATAKATAKARATRREFKAIGMHWQTRQSRTNGFWRGFCR